MTCYILTQIRNSVLEATVDRIDALTNLISCCDLVLTTRRPLPP